MSSDELPSPRVYTADAYFVGDRGARYASPYGSSVYATDSLRYRADADGTVYVYNTTTREVHTIPFVPQKITPLPENAKHTEMYLVRPAVTEKNNIHLPNYVKSRNKGQRSVRNDTFADERYSERTGEKSQPSMKDLLALARKDIDPVAEYQSVIPRDLANRFPRVEKKKAKARDTPKRDISPKNAKLIEDRSLHSAQKPEGSVKAQKKVDEPSKQSNDSSGARHPDAIVQEQATSIEKPSITPVDISLHSTQIVPNGTETCMQAMNNCEIGVSSDSLFQAREPPDDEDIALTDINVHMLPRRLLATKPMPSSKCKIKSNNSAKEIPEAVHDEAKSTGWIDTAPCITKKKSKKKSDANPASGKSQRSEAKVFASLLESTAQPAKEESRCPGRLTLKDRAESLHLRREYHSILEKADASRKNPAARILLLQEALPFAELTQPALEVHSRILEMAELYNEVGEFKRAQDFAEQVMAFVESAEVGADLAREMNIRCNIALGRSYESLVQPDRARPYFEEAFALVQGTQNVSQQASVLSHLGIVHELMGDYAKAFDLYDKTLEMAKLLRDRRVLCETSANLGLAHLSIGDLETADRILSKNIPIARSLRDYSVLSRALTNMAHVQLLRGNLDMAVHYHEQELELNQEHEDSQGAAQALSCLGNVYKAGNNYAQAAKYFMEELSMVQRLGNDARLLESLGCCGAICRLQLMVEQAREFHQRERICAEATSDPVSLAKAILNLADVDVTEARKNPSCRDVLLRTAIERYNRALYHVCEGVPIDERQLYMVKVGCCEAEWRSLDGLETAYRLLNDGYSAVRYADGKHLPLISQYLRATILPSKQAVHEETPKENAIENKAPNIQSRVATFIKNRFYYIDVHALMESLGIDAIIAYSMFWDESETLHAYVLHKDFKDWKSVPIEFSVSSSKALASQGGLYRSLIAGDDLDMPLLPHAIYSKSEKHNVKHPETLDKCIQSLYADFFAPLEDILASAGQAENICIVTDGLIANIPFSILKDLEGRFLVERYALSMIPSIEQLYLLHTRKAQRGEIEYAHNVLSLSNDAMLHIECKKKDLEDDGYCNVRVGSTSDFTGAAQETSARLAVLSIPSLGEMREDFAGSFELSDGRITSETIVEKWKGLRWETVFCDAFSCFTYRVIHESTVGLTRALLAAGTDRVLGMLWTTRSETSATKATHDVCDRSLERLGIRPVRNQRVTLEDFLSTDECASLSGLKAHLVNKMATAHVSDADSSASKIVREFQLECIQAGVSQWLWGAFTLIGLP